MKSTKLQLVRRIALGTVTALLGCTEASEAKPAAQCRQSLGACRDRASGDTAPVPP